MRDAALVRGRHRIRKRNRDREEPREREPTTANQLSQRLPFHELHRQEHRGAVAFDRVKG